jgi:hypothetical protein
MTYIPHPEKYCFGYMVDVDLKDEWVYALNTLSANVKLISICSGHITKKYIECPGFNLDLKGKNCESIGMELKKSLEDQHTDVEVMVHGGPYGNWVIKSNGKFRTDVFTKKELRSKITGVTICIDSNYHPFPENQHLVDKWWERSINITRSILRKHSPCPKISLLNVKTISDCLDCPWRE